MNISIDLKPSREEFIKISGRFNVIPLSAELGDDFISPIQLYSKLKDKSHSFLLESVEGEEKISRFSFVGFNPLYVFKSKADSIEINDLTLGSRKHFKTSLDPLEELKKLMSRFKVFSSKDLRFPGGFVGYLGYDNIRFFEPVLNKNSRIKDAESIFVFCKYLCVFDHKEKNIRIISFVVLPEDINKNKLTSVYAAETEKLKKVIRSFYSHSRLVPIGLGRKTKLLRYKSNISKKDFMAQVMRAKEYIKKGDIIQVVLSQRLEVNYSRDPFDIYRYLRILNPSAYMYYINFKDVKIIGASPEMLLRCENEVLITRPIAGTRPRNSNDQKDVLLEKDLLKDPKEKAEHIMLVDLGRNDLGRVSRKGKVSVPIFMKIERFSHVMHIVSEVRGFMDKKKDVFSALRSCFPAGTVSGAPKIRAMQIIDELEKTSRRIYAGCVGYFSFTGNLDTAIIIRTIVLRKKKAYVQAGAGIVLDSKPEKEYFETLNKAKAQLLALQLAS
ncbi:MAG: anthranilate synthase component I [Candidatus Omnitrophica bacterium]|nr:anthranilate synthase component I [Candidatus Omnitrophota bacterium]